MLRCLGACLITLLFASPAWAQLSDQAKRQLDFCWQELEAGEHDKALKSAASALRLDQGLYEAMICKAEVYEAQGKLNKARTMVGAYLELRGTLAPSERATTVMARLGVGADGELVEPVTPVDEANDFDSDVPPPPTGDDGDDGDDWEDDDKDPLPDKPEKQSGPWSTWDPAVYRWGANQAGGNFVLGGVGLGLFVAGDQLTTLAADLQGVRGRSRTLSAFVTLNHIPLGGAGSLDGPEWAVAYFGEFMFSAGVAMAVPGLFGPIPHLVAATAGADLRTVKSLAGIAGGISLISAGATLTARTAWLYGLEWDNHQHTSQRIHFVVPGIVSMSAAIATLTVGTLDLVFGVLYAAGAVEARESDDVLPTAGRIPAPQITPWFAVDERAATGGVLVAWRLP